MLCNEAREEFGNGEDALLWHALREMPRVVQEIDVFGERIGNLVLGHDAPIYPPHFPVAPLDLQLLQCSPIRQILAVFDSTCVLESATLILQVHVKSPCH